MKKALFIIIVLISISSCNTAIKNQDTKIEIEEGTMIDLSEPPKKIDTIRVLKEAGDIKNLEIGTKSGSLDIDDLIGFWVGYFEKDEKSRYSDKTLYVDEGFIWNRENKINISIDEITDSLVVGHSVVAGNDRPFKGKVEKLYDNSYRFTVKEPGDDKYDGEFSFTISNNQLIGKWSAYRDIDIKYRKYTLEKKMFLYNPDITLERSKEYVNWYKVIETKEEVEMEEDVFEEWISREFASATDLIYEINASNTLLNKSEVENLKKGDLTIIRNTIYARHGYSFRNRPLRVFFDAQSWYIPVHTNIKNDFTDTEIQNIRLLLKYEKNADEYYDRFGRG